MRKLVASAAAAVLVTAAACQTDNDAPLAEADAPTAAQHVDEPDGFSAEVLAPHATFRDEVSSSISVTYAEGGYSFVSDHDDASTVVMARVTWEPGGTSGWHTHPGTVVISVVEGTLEVVNARDCVVHTYEAGEAWIDQGQGNVHTASNPSDTDSTVVYATFFGVPDGGPPTEHVEPADC